MAITREQVKRVAVLARLRLEPAEEERLTVDLDKILESFASLSALDTSGVDPTAHIEPGGALPREDAVTNRPADDALLANAPVRDGRHFRVPKIIE